MKKQWLKYFILMTVTGAALLSCEGMAELFHGPKPPETYTVTFNANGASGTPPETRTVNSGTVLNLPDKGNLSSSGNVFVGWSESPGGIDTIYSAGSAVTITKDMVFYAQWLDASTPQYTVTFNPNGATSGMSPSSQTVYSGISITIPGNGSLSYSGKIFGGWNTQRNGGGTNYSAGIVYTVTGNVMLYAKWNSEIQYTLTYHANGGSGTAPSAQTVDPGTEITIQDKGTLIYSGRKFGGWNTQTNGMGTSYAADDVYTVNGNVTLYAKWIEQYTITFNANGASGTPPQAQTVDPGTVISLPGVGSMTYTGRIFKGWNTQANGSGTGYLEGDTYTVNANVILYAQWESVPIVPPGSTLAEQLAYIAVQSPDGATYDITVSNDVYMTPTSISTMGRNVIVNIQSADTGSVRTIQLEGQGHLFSVDANITLRLQDIVLRGHSNNNKALVGVGQGGKMVLNSGSKISGNTNTPGAGGGINVNGGILEINDGAEIIKNTVRYNTGGDGGGIYVNNNGSVDMRGGLISENSVVYNGLYGSGGGIHIFNNSTVTMSGGIISKNSASYAGGIYIAVYLNSSFTKRATPGSNTSGIIYGGTGNDANIATRSDNGHAIVAFSTGYRNTTLGGFDEITTGNDVGWE